MTVASTTNRKTYAGDNVTTSFATSPVIFYLSSDLQVRVTVTATGVSTLLTENTHYTVSGGSAAGATGTVSLAGGSSPHGALLSTEKLVILRVLPLTQASDLVNNNNSDAEVLEAALDKLTDVDQQLSERQDRALTFPEGDVSGSTTQLQDASVRAGRLLGFDVLGVLTTLAVQVGTSLVDLASSIGASLIGFIQAGTGAVLRSLQSRLRDTVCVFDFMTAAQIIDVMTNAATIDVSSAFTNAFATGRLVYGPAGTYRLSNPAFTVPANGGFYGDGRGTILAVYGATTPDRSTMSTAPSLTGALMTGAGGNLFRNFVVKAADNFDYTKTYESWTAYNYTANNHLIPIAAGTDTIIEGVHFERVFLPVGAISKSRIKVDKCSVDRSVFSAIWTAGCSKVSVTHGDWDRCGWFGGVVFSNVNDLSITSTAWLFNPESTGIDVGGGGTTAKRMVITGNNILAGDPIGVEDGGSDITITGNQCCVAPGYVTNIDLTGINVQLHDVANTPVRTVTITGNNVSFLNPDLTYHDFLGTPIDVGGVAGGQNSTDLTISGNTCRGGEAGIDVHGLAGTVNSNLVITGNNCSHNFYGLKLETTSVGFVAANNFYCGKATTTAGTYGIYMLFGDITDVTFSGNKTTGYEFHFQQDVPGTPTNLNCTRTVVQSHTFLANPGDSGAFTEYRNSGSGTDVNLRPLGRFQQGLATANNLVLGRRGNKFAMTGTTQINLIDNREWNSGDEVMLFAQGGATTVKNGTASSGNNKTIVTNTGADWVSGAGGLGVIHLMYDSSIPGWRETGRAG